MAVRKKLPCPLCPKRSFRSDNWQRHMNSVHPNVSVHSSPPFVAISEDPNTRTPVTSDNAALGNTRIHEVNDDVQHTQSGAERSVPEESVLQAPESNNLALQSSSETGDTTIIEETAGDLSQCTRPGILEHWNGDVLEFKDEPGTDTDHILSCELCWSKISREKQGGHWINHSLISAVKRNNVQLVRHLLAQRANTLFDTDRDGDDDDDEDEDENEEGQFTALHGAIIEDGTDIQIVEMLCEEGASINIPTRRGKTPLGLTCCRMKFREGNNEDYARLLSIIAVLLQSGGDPNIPDRFKVLPLHYLLLSESPTAPCVEMYQNCLGILINKTRNLNVRDNEGDTPLHCVTITSASAVQLLLEKGADPAERNKKGETPLQSTNSIDVLREFIKYRPSSLHIRSRSGDSVLTAHIRKGNSEIVGEIVKMDPSLIRDLNETGETNLHVAIQHFRRSLHNPEIVECLLKAGCDPNQKRADGNTPFHCAMAHMESLIYSGGALSQIAADAACLPTISKHVYSLTILIRFGALINEMNSNGSTPLGILIRQLVRICLMQREYPNNPQISGGRYLTETCFSQCQLVSMFHQYIERVQDLGGKLSTDDMAYATQTMTAIYSTGILETFINASIGSCSVLEPERSSTNPPTQPPSMFYSNATFD